MTDLDTNSRDRLVSVAKGIAGACPFIGSVASEAIGALIPAQRLDRVVEFLRRLESDVLRLDAELENFDRNIRIPEGLDVLEEGLTQASRAVSADRRERLARLVSRSLTATDLKYEESRKVLNLIRDLADPELLWLLFYSMNPVLGPGPHSDFVEKHPLVLKPISREMSAPQEQHDRAALQDSYKNALVRFGLISQQGKSNQITTLGRLVVRYIEESNSDEGAS